MKPIGLPEIVSLMVYHFKLTEGQGVILLFILDETPNCGLDGTALINSLELI